MLKEFWDALTGHAAKVVNPQVIDTGNPRLKTVFIPGRPEGNEFEHFDVAPQLANHTVYSLADLINLAQLKQAERRADGVMIFHDNDEVTLLFDANDRRESATLPLDITAAFAAVKDLCTKATAQKALVKLLRTTLRECVPMTVLNAISKIDVLTNGRQASEIAGGREKGSREFAVEGGRDIPEEFTVTTPVYRTPGVASPQVIKLSLFFDLAATPITFEVAPIADSIESAIVAANRELHETLVKAVPGAIVLEGSP